MRDHLDKQNAVLIRQRVVEDLKEQGFDDFKISLVLNTTEYQVKQLRSGHPLKGRRR